MCSGTPKNVRGFIPEINVVFVSQNTTCDIQVMNQTVVTTWVLILREYNSQPGYVGNRQERWNTKGILETLQNM
jgi:hypothetical protein